jgi:preprotein translocase subunit SecG
MSMLESILLVVHVMVALAVCGFVLLQHGKGADMGAAFGSGASGSLFGAAGSANFLSRTTAVLAAVFFLSSLGLTWFGTTHNSAPKSVIEKGVMDALPVDKAAEVPVAPAVPAPAQGGAAEPAKSTAPAAPAGGPAGSKAGDVPK